MVQRQQKYQAEFRFRSDSVLLELWHFPIQCSLFVICPQMKPLNLYVQKLIIFKRKYKKFREIIFNPDSYLNGHHFWQLWSGLWFSKCCDFFSGTVGGRYIGFFGKSILWWWQTVATFSWKSSRNFEINSFPMAIEDRGISWGTVNLMHCQKINWKRFCGWWKVYIFVLPRWDSKILQRNFAYWHFQIEYYKIFLQK